MKKFILISLMSAIGMLSCAQVPSKDTYLDSFKDELQKKWPQNKTLNIVFHGHSVPTGYARTPQVNTLQAYPHMLLYGIKTQYPNAVVNVITTSIGGEQAEHGEKRFEDEVLTHRPLVLLIDYALNDRNIGLERAEAAWRKMIESAKERNIKIILLTPTPDLKENILDENSPLSKHSEMIRKLASEYQVGLVDSYKIFQNKAKVGQRLEKYMSQNNHPNPAGHAAVASEIMTWFF